MQDQRAHVRRLVQAHAKLASANGKQWVEVQLLDISRMGLAFASAETVEEGSTRMLRFSLPDSPVTNEVFVKIVHNGSAGANGTIRVGARFAAIEQACTERIAAFVAQ